MTPKSSGFWPQRSVLTDPCLVATACSCHLYSRTQWWNSLYLEPCSINLISSQKEKKICQVYPALEIPPTTERYHLAQVSRVKKNLQLTPEFQKSYSRYILPVKLFSRWRNRFMVLPTLPSSQNALSSQIDFLNFILNFGETPHTSFWKDNGGDKKIC